MPGKASYLIRRAGSVAFAAVEANAVAASEMRSTTNHVTAMIPVAATGSQNATAAQKATLSTRRLAIGIVDINSTARASRDQAEALEGRVGKFIFEESVQASFNAPRKRAAPPAVSQNH